MLNITRIRPRRRAFSRCDVAAVASQNCFLQLQNNSQYAEYILIWDFVLWPAAAGFFNLSVGQTTLAGSAQPVTSFIPNEAPPPGALTAGANATVITAQYEIASASTPSLQWPHDYPFCLIPPLWYFTIQDATVNQRMICSLTWEAIKPEQLDEGAWEVANLTALAAQGG